MDGLDKARCSCLIVERLTQLAHGGRQDALADYRLRPHHGQQRLFGDELSWMAHQTAQHRKSLVTQADRLMPTPQAFVHQVESERRKYEVPRLLHTPLALVVPAVCGGGASRLQNFFRTF